MKKQRYRFRLLGLLLTLLFLVLAVYGFFAVSRYGNRWFSSGHNSRITAQKSNVIEGSILDVNGVVLAYTEDGNRVFQPDSASRSAVVHIVGDRQGQVANAVETFQTGQLYGFHTSVPDMIASLVNGTGQIGNSVELTVDSRLCTSIAGFFSDRLPGKKGAAVVVDYTTGEVRAMVSLPGFDPDNITEETLSSPDTPFWNRAIQGLYPPGSTFKVVTASAALNNLPDASSCVFECTGSLAVSAEHAIHDFKSEAHGMLEFKNAFRLSCNPFFANLALQLGDNLLRKEAENYGFNDNFLFRDLVVENSRYPTVNRTDFEIALSGIGQSGILASPLHMCLIACAVANGGVMQEPRLVHRILNATGRVLETSKAEVYRNVCSGDVADTLKSYMRGVVQNGGSGWRANVSGLDICGKTGTAESTLQGIPINYGWFIGFNAQSSLPYAVCILVEDIADGETGGTTSALIAGDIFRALQKSME